MDPALRPRGEWQWPGGGCHRFECEWDAAAVLSVEGILVKAGGTRRNWMSAKVQEWASRTERVTKAYELQRRVAPPVANPRGLASPVHRQAIHLPDGAMANDHPPRYGPLAKSSLDDRNCKPSHPPRLHLARS